MLWPVRAKIYWDLDYDVPVIRPEPGSENKVFELKLTEPGDARPAFTRDYSILDEAIAYEFGDRTIYREFFDGRILLLNKVPHWDQMWEVVSSGNVVGQLYYDPFIKKWRFRLNSTGAYMAYTQNIVDYIVLDTKWVKEKAVIRENYSTSSKQVVIVNKDGIPLGLAENKNGRLVVLKAFKKFIKPLVVQARRTNISDAIKRNEYGIYYFESRAKAFLFSMYNKVRKKVVVSYSGGKDSLVSLHLTLSTVGDAILLFNNTGLELPETIENVDRVSSIYGVKTVYASAGDAFWRSVHTFGPPGKDYRWCCKITKLVPLARVARVKWSNGALNIVGQRAFESLDRAKSPRVWRNKWIPNLLSISPIQEWSQLHVWLYILKYKLPYNPAYDMGFERLGCYLCPSCTLAEFKTLENTHKELWQKWIKILEIWRKKLAQPKEWVELGLWRWLTPARAKERIVRRVPGYVIDWRKEYLLRLAKGEVALAPRVVSKTINENGASESGVIVFNRSIIPDKDAIKAFEININVLGYRLTRSKTRINIAGKNMEASIDENTIHYQILSREGIEELIDIIKIIYRVNACVSCGSCVIWCPQHAIRLTQYGPLPRLPCNSCRICIDVCPIADVLVEKVVVPLILGKPDAWKRPTKRRRENVIELFRSLGLIP